MIENVVNRTSGNWYIKIFAVVFALLIVISSSIICFADDTSEDITEGNTEIQVLRVSPSDTSGFHAVMLSLLGDYNPIVKDYTYQSNNGYTSHSIDIQPDWSWIASCAVFLVVIYCCFRLIGVVLGGIKK